MSGVGGGREADGGGSGLGPSRDSEVTGSGPSPTKTSSSFLLSDPHSQGSLALLQQPAMAGLEWKVMERRGARSLGPGLPPRQAGVAVGGRTRSVYPGHALPEQMGTCQCCQPGTGLRPSHCQVAGDLRPRRGACLVWLFMRGSLSSWELSAHLSEHSLQGARDTGHSTGL